MMSDKNNIEYLKSKLLKSGDLNDEELKILTENLSKEEASNILNTFLENNKSYMNLSDIFNNIESQLRSIYNYIARSLEEISITDEKNMRLVGLLSGLQIFISNFISDRINIENNDIDTKWEFK